MDNDVEMQPTSEELNNNSNTERLPATDEASDFQSDELLAKLKINQELERQRINHRRKAPMKNYWSFMEVVFTMTGVCIPSPTRWLLLGLCFAFLKYQADKLMTQFDLKLGKPYDGSKPAVMTMGKAFEEFILEIIDESTIMVCYPLVLLLICPLEPIYQILFLLKLIVAPLYYIPPLLAKASMIGVTYGLLNLPLFLFTTLAAFVLSLIIQFIVLLLIYLNHRCILATTERPRMGGHEVGMKRFPQQGHVIDINLKSPKILTPQNAYQPSYHC